MDQIREGGEDREQKGMELDERAGKERCEQEKEASVHRFLPPDNHCSAAYTPRRINVGL
jgi:hypothetical protein